jgi:glycerate 2-kinase
MPPTKQIAREIFRQTLSSIDIPLMMERKLAIEGTRLVLPEATIDLAPVSRVLVIGIGKAAHAMVAGLTSLLPPGLSLNGVVAAPTKSEAPVPGLHYFLAGHPTPNQSSWHAAEAAAVQLCSNSPSIPLSRSRMFRFSIACWSLAEPPSMP